MRYETQIREQTSTTFGSAINTRACSSGAYRYGFNGKELDKDEEGMGGGGSTYDYGFRIYNPNLAKFLSVDPLSPKYPWYTPYQFAGNIPIWAIDLDGLEAWVATEKWPIDIHINFAAYVSGKNIINNNIKRTCEDLIIGIIIDFANTNSLALKMIDSEDNNNEYNSKSENYNNITQFKYATMKNFYAENLRTSGLFKKIGETNIEKERLNIKAGDILFSMRNTNRAHHVQIVTETGIVTEDLINQWTKDGKTHLTKNFKVGDKYAIIKQGNFDGETSIFVEGEEDPEDEDYIGSSPQTAFYNLTDDTYIRDYGTNDVTQNFSKTENQQITNLDSSKQEEVKK